MKKILFPTDFTDTSLNAIKYGLSLFKDEPCEIYLLNTFQVPTPIHGEPVPFNQPSGEKIKASFENIELEIKKSYPNSNFTFKEYYKVGGLTSTTSTFIKHHNVDLIILGTHEAHGVDEFLLGSHAADIMKNVNCPVLTVPAYVPSHPPKNIAIAIDDVNELTETAIYPLIDIAKRFKSEVIVLHVSEGNGQEFSFEGLEEYFKDVKHSYYTIFDNDVPKGLEDFVKYQDVSMIGILTHKLNFMERIFQPSVSKKLALHGNAPILSMNIGK